MKTHLRFLFVILCLFSALALKAGDVLLTWNDNSTNETSFKIERATGSGPFAPIDTVAANVRTYTDANIAQSGTAALVYNYRVRASNSAGDSAYSNTATVTVPILVTPPNGAPSGATATFVATVATNAAGELNATMVLTTPAGTSSATITAAMEKKPGRGWRNAWEWALPQRAGASTPVAPSL